MREKSKIIYNCMNILVLSLGIIWFFLHYWEGYSFFKGNSLLGILLLLGTVILVHGIKAVRLYFALFDTGIKFSEHIKIYCKVTPISVILPLKAGELFRMYCYGHEIGNYLKGIVIILLDRFMDTLALVTVFAGMWLVGSEKLSLFFIALMAFMLVILALYLLFPEMYLFWNRYILHLTATRGNMTVLKVLESLNGLYFELKSTVRGRGIMLYILSLIAWCVEIGSVILFGKLESYGNVGVLVSDYLTSALSGHPTEQMMKFVYLSVWCLLIAYVLIKLIGSGEKRIQNEHNSDI